MKPYNEWKAEIEVFQHQIYEAMKNELTNVLKEVKHHCKEFNFPDGIIKGSLPKVRVIE